MNFRNNCENESAVASVFYKYEAEVILGEIEPDRVINAQVSPVNQVTCVELSS